MQRVQHRFGSVWDEGKHEGRVQDNRTLTGRMVMLTGGMWDGLKINEWK